MKRKIYKELLEWKNNKKNKKPLMLLGARQVGKTYILEEFCKKEFENYIYINLFDSIDVVQLYNENYTSEQKLLKLKALLKTDIEDQNTVLFIDEIQESEKLISELKFFQEKHSNINIVCAGSLLGVMLKRSKFSFPVGKVWRLELFPMDFEEYLMAFHEDGLIREIKNCYDTNNPIFSPFHNKALDYYRLYLCTGGMPESVKEIVDSNMDITKYNPNIIKDIVSSYFDDMSKYVSNNNEHLKIRRIYASIPEQLGNQSNKFQFSKLSTNARIRDYETALDWLEATNLIERTTQISLPQKPLKLFMKGENFKLYLNDVGLLIHNLNIDYSDIILDKIQIGKGLFTENYVANQLVALNIPLYYWNSNYSAEVDFLIENQDGVIPIEVKAANNTKSKSLNLYIEKYNPSYAIRISTKNFGFENGIKSVPLYAVFCLKKENK